MRQNIKSIMRILWTLVYRNIFPASSGERWREVLSYRILVSWLPPLGIILVLGLITYAGIWQVAADERVSTRLKEIKESPYMALFGEGNLHKSDVSNEQVPPKKTYSYWNDLTIGEIPILSAHSPEEVRTSRCFKKVTLFQWSYLKVKPRPRNTINVFHIELLPLQRNIYPSQFIRIVKKNPKEDVAIFKKIVAKVFSVNEKDIKDSYSGKGLKILEVQLTNPISMGELANKKTEVMSLCSKNLKYLRISCWEPGNFLFVSERGMALAFEGEQADQDLLEEIRENLIYINNDKAVQLPNPEDEAIIISKKAFMRYGYELGENANSTLTVTPYEDEPPIKLKIYLAERLPYQCNYIISDVLWKKLNEGYYQKASDNFSLELIPSKYIKDKTAVKKSTTKIQKDSEIQKLKSILAEEFSLNRDSIMDPYGGKDLKILDIPCPSPILRREIVKKKIGVMLQIEDVLKYYLVSRWELGSDGSSNPTETYNGAIFYLNPDFFDRRLFDENSLFDIQEFMDSPDLDVGGDLLWAIKENHSDHEHLKRMRLMFFYGWCVAVALLGFFFVLVLHSRMHRIGTQRMLGMSERSIVFACFLEGSLLFIVASFLAVLFFQLSPPPDFGFALFKLKVWIKMLFTWITAEIGLLIPTILFLKKLYPTEMLNYRD